MTSSYCIWKGFHWGKLSRNDDRLLGYYWFFVRITEASCSIKYLGLKICETGFILLSLQNIWEGLKQTESMQQHIFTLIWQCTLDLNMIDDCFQIISCEDTLPMSTSAVIIALGSKENSATDKPPYNIEWVFNTVDSS